jgi:hypothetical protein
MQSTDIWFSGTPTFKLSTFSTPTEGVEIKKAWKDGMNNMGGFSV